MLQAHVKGAKVDYAAIIAFSTLGWSEPVVREWTSTDGKKLIAEYLGVKGDEVALKLQGGKISQVPLSRLSPEDNAFIKANPLVHHVSWATWPPGRRRPTTPCTTCR